MRSFIYAFPHTVNINTIFDITAVCNWVLFCFCFVALFLFLFIFGVTGLGFLGGFCYIYFILLYFCLFCWGVFRC